MFELVDQQRIARQRGTDASLGPPQIICQPLSKLVYLPRELGKLFTPLNSLIRKLEGELFAEETRFN